MAVAVAEFEGLDAPGARLDGIAECLGTGAHQRTLAILFPGSIQCLESRLSAACSQTVVVVGNTGAHLSRKTPDSV